MKDRFKRLYMDIAQRVSEESYAVRLKVGCIIVKEDRIISIGYNGTPAGWDNCCENEIIEKNGGLMNTGSIKLETKKEVTHAEANALGKLAKCSESGNDAIMFTTHQPCLECAKTIAVSGIKIVYYKYPYRNNEGIEHLHMCGVEVYKEDS